MTYSKTVAIFTGNPQFNVVESYYKLVPFERAADQFTLAINKIVRVPQLNFEKLLDTMLIESANFDMFLLVDHGISNSVNKVWRLSMALTANTQMKVRDDVMAKLLEFLNGDPTEAAMTDYEKNHQRQENKVTLPPLPKGCISRIVDKMRQLRQKRVRWVNFRACALWTNPDFMNTLGQCFSALFVNAPDKHMFFSPKLVLSKPATDVNYKEWMKKHADARIFTNSSGQDLAVQVQGMGPQRNTPSITQATDLKWFMDQYFDKGNKYPTGANHLFPFQIVGMDTLSSIRYALPNEPEYAQHIIWTNPLPGNLI